MGVGGAPRTDPCPGTTAAKGTGGRRGRLAGAGADHRERQSSGENLHGVNITMFPLFWYHQFFPDMIYFSLIDILLKFLF